MWSCHIGHDWKKGSGLVPLFDAEDLVSVATLTASLFATVLLVGVVAALSRRGLVGSRLGWLLVAGGIFALAVRVLGHFVHEEAALLQALRDLLGIAGAVLITAGFVLLARSATTTEATPDGA